MTRPAALASSLPEPSPGSRRLERVIAHVPQFAGALSITVGAVVLGSWMLAHPWRSLLGRREVFMVGNTAVMSILAGAALWLSARATAAPRARTVARACAVAVLAIAGITLLEYATDWVLIDHWLPSAPGPWPRGRSSPHTASAFVLLGAALLLIDHSGRGRRPSDYLALTAMLIGTSALLGYLFGIPAYGALLSHLGMSPSTATVVLAIAAGVLAARIEHGVLAVMLARNAGGVAARRMLGGLSVFPPVAIALLWGALHWYPFSFASALVVLLALGGASSLILSTARRLSAIDNEMWRVTRALGDSEAHVRSLVDGASDGILISDLDGRYTQVNEAACRILGYDRNALVGKTIMDVLAPHELPRLAAHKLRLLAGATDVSEWTVQRGDGSMMPIEVSAKIFADGRWQGIIRDISERKRVETALARAADTERTLRAELEALLGASGSVSEAVSELAHSDLDAVLRTIAEQARSLLNADYAAAAIAGEHGLDRWAAAGAPELRDAIAPSPPIPDPSRASVLAVPLRHHNRELGTLHIAVRERELTDTERRVLAALAERVAPAVETAVLYAAEARLRTWLQSLIDQLPEGVIVLDEHGQVNAMNRAVRALALGPTGEHDPWGNEVVFDIRGADQRPMPFDDLPIVRALRDGEIVRDREMWLRQPDGRMVPVSGSAGPVRDDRGRLTGAIAVVSDISDRKEMERLREEWTAVVAHDLRQPLNTILLWTDRVQALSTSDAQRTGIERVRRAGWRLNHMIEDLLDAARIQANQLALDLRPLDMLELVRTAVDNIQVAHPALEIDIVGPPRELAWVDGERIQQVLGNLLGNAVKYGVPTTPIRIEIANRDSLVEVAVCNQGAEIPPAELDKLFTRFSRTTKAREARVPGLGLGLYICRGLIDAHGGRIWAESAHGTNAFRFTVRRPPEGS
ncbi:MAG TPA: PAS domain S-box protein [Kofleriaceae bacterium]|nr:PAS domain S-box protein [Kofleriaceae bacterium]